MSGLIDASDCPCSRCTIRPCENPGLCCKFALWLTNPVVPCVFPDSADVGSRIKYYRKQKGLTQEGLAQAIGVTNAAVARYENGSREPRISTLTLIANALGIRLVDLVGGNGNE